MLGFKRFKTAAITIAGIELPVRIRKGQFDLRRLRLRDQRAPAVCPASNSWSNDRHTNESARPSFGEHGPLVDRKHALMQDERGAKSGALVAEFRHFDLRHLIVGADGGAHGRLDLRCDDG
jgi:hypothetical protein